MDGEIDILVLGIGNLLWADEGFGVRAVEALDRRYRFAQSVTLMDGGTQGLYLLPYVRAARRLLVFDAVDYQLQPGSFKVVRDGAIPAYLGIRKVSLHQSSFQEVLALAMLGGAVPQSMVLVGVQPADIGDYGGSLSDVVRARLPQAVELAREVLEGWGAPAQPRAAAGSGVINAEGISLENYEQGRPSPQQACRVGDARVLQRRQQPCA